MGYVSDVSSDLHMCIQDSASMKGPGGSSRGSSLLRPLVILVPVSLHTSLHTYVLIYISILLQRIDITFLKISRAWSSHSCVYIYRSPQSLRQFTPPANAWFVCSTTYSLWLFSNFLRTNHDISWNSLRKNPVYRYRRWEQVCMFSLTCPSFLKASEALRTLIAPQQISPQQIF